MFREKNSLEKRIQESTRIRDKYPDRIPIICEKRARDTHIPPLTKYKYLVPADFTVGQFIHVIRKKIELTPEQALFVFLDNNTMPSTHQILGHIYDENRNEDGFLYIIYTGENTFGKN